MASNMLCGRKQKTDHEGRWTSMAASTRNNRQAHLENGEEKEENDGTLGVSAAGTPWNVETG